MSTVSITRRDIPAATEARRGLRRAACWVGNCPRVLTARRYRAFRDADGATVRTEPLIAVLRNRDTAR